MQLLTEDLRRRIPALYSQQRDPDPMVICKFFDPTSAFTWYVIEFDGVDRFYGLVKGQEAEFGFFHLRTLQEHRGRFGIGIERDLYFTPCPLSQARHE